MLQIRQATALDSAPIWDIFHAVVARGDTYTFDPGIGREDGLAYWLHSSNWCHVAEREQNVVGTYILRANQPGLGAHIANAAFMVSPAARGLGVGRAMGEHSLSEARRLGFRAMQFNFVVSTNEPAVGRRGLLMPMLCFVRSTKPKLSLKLDASPAAVSRRPLDAG
jgi:GNAT superfamily N-acetyltransferase